MLSSSFDVVDLLTRDHRLLERLLDDLDRERQPLQASVLLVQLSRELATHEDAEQGIAFPALSSTLPVNEVPERERLSEHQEINQLVADMKRLMPEEPGFDTRASTLRVQLYEHFHSEEMVVFPRLRACLDRHQLVDLAEQVMSARAEQAAVPSTSSPKEGHR
jgi:hemerythrin superfamily protein